MNPMAIMAIISMALPLLQELLAVAEKIGASVMAASQPGSPTATALPDLQAIQAAHAASVANVVVGLLAGTAGVPAK